VSATGHHAHFRDQIDVGEGSSPEPNEFRGIEPSLEVLESMIDRVTLASGGRQMEQFAVGQYGRNLVYRNDQHLVKATNGNPFDERRFGGCFVGGNCGRAASGEVKAEMREPLAGEPPNRS
jgi:hypothetical protein